MSLYARPNRNGNTEQHFRDAGRKLHAAVPDLREALVDVRSEIMNGRNYQTVEEAQGRERDLLRVNKYLEALIAIEQLAVEVFQQGEAK